MEVIGTVKGSGDGYDDPGSVHVGVNDAWQVELVVEGRDGGPTAKVILAPDLALDSASALALFTLQAERRVAALLAGGRGNTQTREEEMQ
jgi:hypothetical protein